MKSVSNRSELNLKRGSITDSQYSRSFGHVRFDQDLVAVRVDVGATTYQFDIDVWMHIAKATSITLIQGQ